MNSNNLDWYRDAVIYEIFVRAFADGNGDGIGDLPVLIFKLDYMTRPRRRYAVAAGDYALAAAR